MHVLHDLVLDGVVRSLHGVVVIEGFLYLRWRGTESKKGQNMVAEMVMESAWNQAAFWVIKLWIGSQARCCSPIFVEVYMVLVMVPANVNIFCA